MDSSTQRSGNLAVGAPVTVQYRMENKKNLATAVRERMPGSDTKPARKTGKS